MGGRRWLLAPNTGRAAQIRAEAPSKEGASAASFQLGPGRSMMPRRWSDKFDVPVTPGPVAGHVRAARQREGRANAQNTKILAPRIEAHLQGYGICLQELGAFHSQIGDHSDLDLEGNSRQVAAWFISGRVIGLLKAGLSLCRAGFASEVVPILRTAHEATQLLRAVSMHRDANILQDWLQDQHIKPSRVRTAEDRNQKHISMEMRDMGFEAPGRTRQFMEALYKDLSEMAHVKRSRILEIASIKCREMPVNGHPSATIRAFYVYLLGIHVMEAVSAVGFALGISRGDEVVVRTQATLATLQELVRKIPIDPGTLQGNTPGSAE